MSVQLIVYPQSFDGFTNSNNPSTQILVDGINFSTINTSISHSVTAANGLQEAIDFFNPTLPVNTWKRYLQGSLVSSETNGILRISTSATTQQQGVIQKLSNLIVGGVYNITVDIDSITNVGNVFNLSIFSGTILQSSQPFPPSSTTGTSAFQFTANSTEDTLVIGGNSSSGGILTIKSIGIKAAPTLPSGAIQLLEDGQVILDLYEDEDLPLSLSVDDFKNVVEQVQSYSKAFNLPATKRNNRIFDHIFEITREVESAGSLLFNPYQKTTCVLKQDGFVLFEGNLRMIDITDKDGEISYNVNLYSEVVALADILKDRTFRDLEFEELNHEYVYSNIKNSWTGVLELINPLSAGSFAGTTGSVLTNVLQYPFVDWNHQYYFGINNQLVLSNLESSFRPFINIKYIIDNIFAATDYTYESEFFLSTDFTKLFMDFNWGSQNTGAVPVRNANFIQAFNTSGGSYFFNSSYTKFKLQDNTFGNNSLWDNTEYKLVSDINNLEVTADYKLKCQNDTSGSRANSVRISKFNSSGQVLEVFAVDNNDIGGNLTKTFQGTLSTVLQVGEYIQAQSSSPTANTVKISESSPMSSIEFNLNSNSSQVVPLLDSLRGDLGQWQFLKGLITMFNLVTLPDENNPNNIKIEPYTDVFVTPALTEPPLNWTEKIDVSEMKLKPLTDLNRKTMFKFVEDDDDTVFIQYKNQVGNHLYGSQQFNATNQFNILEGEVDIVAEPFAATIVKSIMPNFTDFITPAIYAMNDEGTESFENSPRIMYNNGVKTLQNNSYKVLAQNGGSSVAAETQFLQFSHLSEIPTSSASPSNTLDFHFGICQLEANVGSPTPKNLFNLYWLPYYLELYNPNTRIMTIRVNLTPADISTFKFNNTVYLKNKTFRVNKIDYKPNDLATVEFILIP